MKYGTARRYRCKFHDERVPSRQTIHNLVNKLRSAVLSIDKEQKYKCQVLTEEKLDDTGARLEHTPRKSLKHLAPETGVSKSCTRRATQALKLRSYKTTVIDTSHAAVRISLMGSFCSWFLQSVAEGEIDLRLTFFLMKRGITCRNT
jgi:hypothetical protein